MHYSKTQDNLFTSYFLALIPILIFGFYKNGLYLYLNNLISFKTMLLPVYFYAISIIIGLLTSYILKANYRLFILNSLIICASISLNTNYLIYPILLFVLLFISNILSQKCHFNQNSIIRLFLILALLLNLYRYENIAELTNVFNYNLFDKFLGFTKGGIASTSLFLNLSALIILSFNKFYKKSIALSASLSFFIVSLVLAILTSSPLNIVFEGHIYYFFIFIASDIYVSPSTKEGMLIYGFIIGLLSAILSKYLFYEGAILSIFLVSLFIPLINILINKKYLKSS